MKRIMRDKLAELGISIEKYFVEAPAFDWEKGVLAGTQLMPETARKRNISTGPIWGLALMLKGKEIGVIEQTPRAHDYDQDGKYHIRARRSVTGMERAPGKGSYRTQREAIAELIRREYCL